jgi:hypothetical protein
MVQTTRPDLDDNATERTGDEGSRARWIAAGSILGALAASSCCILPLVRFRLGISGAWIADFTALAPYKPYLTAGTLALLGYAHYLVYVKPKQACADGVTESEVSYKDKSALVTFDDRKANVQALIAAAANAG